jgi:XTP/dITP diphosphohydrolase
VKLYCATTSLGKLREFRLAGQSHGIEVETVPGLPGIPPPEETGATFEENAVVKAVYYSRYAPGPVFADDSGLEVDALDGAPGVHSARFAGPDATDDENNRLLMEKLRGIEDRSARFVCVIALAEGGQMRDVFRGTVEGLMVHEPRGRNGFGYDPLFFYGPFGATFGEADPEAKMEVSHRGKALRLLMSSFEH